MKQYCRYCCNACLNDDELAYCSYKDGMLDGPALRRLNHCKGFLFCELDVLTQTRIYQPRVAKPPSTLPGGFRAANPVLICETGATGIFLAFL